MAYYRAAALASGHTPEEIRDMTLGDLEALAIFRWSHRGLL